MTVTVVVPWSGPVPLASDAVTTRAVVARLEVAVLVFLVDHRLGRERLPGRRRRRRLRSGSTSWLAAAGLTTIGTLAVECQAAARELERDGLGRVVGEVGERGHAARQRGRERALERAGATAQVRRHDRAVVAGLEIAVLVLFIRSRAGSRTAWPAVAVCDGCVWMTSWRAPPG